VEKYLAHRQHRQELAEKFMSNPYEFIEPAVKHLSQQMAQEVVQKELKAQREQSFAREFVSRESGWLYEHDQQGQRKFQTVLNPQTGALEPQPILSQWGSKLRDYVMEESRRQQQRGYNDLEEQQRYALQRVQLDYALSQIQSGQQATPPATPAQNDPSAPAAPAPTPRQTANDQFLRTNGGLANGQPATPASVLPPSQPSRGLAALLREDFQKAGITDQTFATAR
jgi:hypothetical protein